MGSVATLVVLLALGGAYALGRGSDDSETAGERVAVAASTPTLAPRTVTPIPPASATAQPTATSVLRTDSITSTPTAPASQCVNPPHLAHLSSAFAITEQELIASGGVRMVGNWLIGTVYHHPAGGGATYLKGPNGCFRGVADAAITGKLLTLLCQDGYLGSIEVAVNAAGQAAVDAECAMHGGTWDWPLSNFLRE